jgi:hypothetical protein
MMRLTELHQTLAARARAAVQILVLIRARVFLPLEPVVRAILAVMALYIMDHIKLPVAVAAQALEGRIHILIPLRDMRARVALVHKRLIAFTMPVVAVAVA